MLKKPPSSLKFITYCFYFRQRIKVKGWHQDMLKTAIWVALFFKKTNGFPKTAKRVWETQLLGRGRGRQKHLNSNIRRLNLQPHSPQPPTPPTRRHWKRVKLTEEKQAGWVVGREGEEEAGSRKFSAIPGIKVNAGGRRTQEAPLPFSLSPVCT